MLAPGLGQSLNNVRRAMAGSNGLRVDLL